MAAGGDFSEFDTWLNNKLLACNTDEGVFGSYIKGILEGEESLDDKTQALTEILSEITVIILTSEEFKFSFLLILTVFIQ